VVYSLTFHNYDFAVYDLVLLDKNGIIFVEKANNYEVIKQAS